MRGRRITKRKGETMIEKQLAPAEQSAGTTSGPARSNDRDQIIRDRAYAIWEEEGRPDGRHEEHWLRAEQEHDADALADEAPA